MIIEKLNFLGVDTKKAIERFMDDEELYLSILKNFGDSVRYKDILAVFEAKDYKLAYDIAHRLKGVTGNFGMNTLFEAYSAAAELLKNGENDKAYNLIKDILPLQNKIIEITDNI